VRTELYDAIVDRIREYDNVSLVEIERKFKEFGVPTDGDLLISLNPDYAPNIIIWSGVSTEFHDIYDQLACDYRFKLTICSELTYLAEGSRGPGLPLAEDLTDPTQYKTPHWVPVVFKSHVDSNGIRLP
jgi:hypothetical protein